MEHCPSHRQSSFFDEQIRQSTAHTVTEPTDIGVTNVVAQVVVHGCCDPCRHQVGPREEQLQVDILEGRRDRQDAFVTLRLCRPLRVDDNCPLRHVDWRPLRERLQRSTSRFNPSKSALLLDLSKSL